jgi:hypothetical protein
MNDAVNIKTSGTSTMTAKVRRKKRIKISMPKETCILEDLRLIALLVMVGRSF